MFIVFSPCVYLYVLAATSSTVRASPKPSTIKVHATTYTPQVANAPILLSNAACLTVTTATSSIKTTTLTSCPVKQEPETGCNGMSRHAQPISVSVKNEVPIIKCERSPTGSDISGHQGSPAKQHLAVPETPPCKPVVIGTLKSSPPHMPPSPVSRSDDVTVPCHLATSKDTTAAGHHVTSSSDVTDSNPPTSGKQRFLGSLSICNGNTGVDRYFFYTLFKYKAHYVRFKYVLLACYIPSGMK